MFFFHVHAHSCKYNWWFWNANIAFSCQKGTVDRWLCKSGERVVWIELGSTWELPFSYWTYSSQLWVSSKLDDITSVAIPHSERELHLLLWRIKLTNVDGNSLAWVKQCFVKAALQLYSQTFPEYIVRSDLSTLPVASALNFPPQKRNSFL